MIIIYTHLGGERVIRSSELVIIFDASIEKSTKLFKQFIADKSRTESIEIIGGEEPKSVVITGKKVYYSPVSPATLKKRVCHFNE